MESRSSLSSLASSTTEKENHGDKHVSVFHESEESELITVTSGDTPNTWASKFEDLNLSPELMNGLYVEMKFRKPSNVQAKSLPMIMTPPHKHLIAQAHNGSGKTTCLVLGMLTRVDTTLLKPQALCICPTSELANQNLDLLQKIGKYTRITAQLAIPEATRGVSITKLAPVTAHVVIGTPGTVKKWINFKKLGLTCLKILVFDEPDLMLATDGFMDDSLKVTRDINKVNSNVQVCSFFSVTLNQTLKDFAAKIVKDQNQLFVMKQCQAVERKDLAVVINDLPDEIICHILSFLPTKTAASTSLVSKRWRYLLAAVRTLDFDDSIYLHFEKRKLTRWDIGYGRSVIYVDDKWCMRSTSFVDFVDRVLALHHDSTLRKFSLKTIDCYDPVDPERVTPWIHKALALCVSDLHLVMDWGRDLDFLLPSEIFSSKTLVRLRIENVGEASIIEVEDSHLPKLKTLHLKSVSFRKENIGFSNLLTGCKVLEELSLEGLSSHMWESFSVSVTTLKRLTFGSEHKAVHSPSNVSFDTPNLIYLEYSEVHARKYLKVNLESLVEARSDLRFTKEQERMAKSIAETSGNEENDMFYDATEFMKGICNVQQLYLSGSTLEVLRYCCKAIPIFSNLTHLTIKSRKIFGWESLPGLLQSCPNLITLVFKGLLHRCRDVCLCKSDDLTCLSTSPVKVVKILIDDGKIEEHVEQAKHFLETMVNLEQLVLYDDSLFDQDLVRVSTQLQMLASVVSQKCKVQLIPNNLSSTKWGPRL